MNTEQIKISGSSWRLIIAGTLPAYAVIILVHLFVMHKPIADFVPSLIGIVIGILVVSQFSMFKKNDIVISSDYVEGPIRSGLLGRRHAVPLQNIDIARSKKPSFTRGGYIRTYDNQRIILLVLYFSPSQGNAIFEEIKKRLTNQSTLH